MKRTSLFFLFFFVWFLFCINAGTIRLNDFRYFAYEDYTRFVLDLSSPIKIVEKKLPGKSGYRLYFDLKNCTFGKAYPKDKTKEIVFDIGHLKRIRIGKRGKFTLRVVFDFTEVNKYNLFYLNSPYRIVFDFFKNSPKLNSRNKIRDKKNIDLTIDNKLTETKLPKSINGKYSLARQLGLGVRRIIIDPGHGGRDPGTMNLKYHLYEKRIALDISKRVRALFKKHKNIEVILTRDSDRYLALEERTAIANSHKGDLFISIHINSAPRKKVNGIETYYLSMTTDPHAIMVAAQENAISKTSLAELNNIVNKIIKNTKKEESKTLAESVQKALISKTRAKYRGVTNLGVKKAPFYVLVGAEMPAILVETSFVSNRVEAERLRRTLYRETLAVGIYSGIVKYIKALGKI